MIEFTEYLAIPEVGPVGPKQQAESRPIISRKLSELVRHDENDPAELLKRRYLCRGGTLLLCGPTGIGKSSFSMQCMVLWALGRDAFGIEPSAPLTSLLIQAENDDGDLAEMRDGVIAGLNLCPEDAQAATERVIVVSERCHTGTMFFSKVVRPKLAEHKPDLLWIDPALAYLGGDASSQSDVGAFLRNGLTPLLSEFNCGSVVVHHTNKPAIGREKATWQAGDFAYLGSGSAEWANVARAVLAIRSIGSHEVFELTAGKRGARLGWTEQGERSYTKYVAHATEPGVICWREVDPETARPATGRPANYSAEDVLSLLPPEGMTSTEWRDEAARECGIKERRFYDLRKELEKDGKILKSKINKRWQPLSK